MGESGRAAGASPACARRSRPGTRGACGWLLVLLALCVAWQAGWQAIARAGAGSHLHILALNPSGADHDHGHDHHHHHARPAADHAHGPGTVGVVMLDEESSGGGAATVRTAGKRMLLDLDAALNDDAARFPPGARGRYGAPSRVPFETRSIPPLERPPIG